MGTPFLGEIRMFSFDFPPKGWARCAGQLLPINQNQALFSLLGTTYGGNGQVNFALPDLRDRAPMHFGDGTNLGQTGGEAAHTLTMSEMAAHNHLVASGGSAQVASPAGARASTSLRPAYGSTTDVAMSPASVTNAGGSQPHSNLPPYLVIFFGIAIQGAFPSQT